MSGVLGIDTATADTAVAVTGDAGLAERRTVPAPGGRPRHSEALLRDIEDAVAEAGGWKGITLIGVGTGPGSYTGLRIGIATARALAQSLERPIAGISSLAALARGIGGLAEAEGRPRLAAIDGRRGELFAALEDASGRQLWAPFVAGPEEVARRLAELSTPPLACGDGALRFRNELENAGVTVPADSDPAHRIEARHICELAATAEPQRPDKIEPTYLRAPDAEVWLERDRRQEQRG